MVAIINSSGQSWETHCVYAACASSRCLKQMLAYQRIHLTVADRHTFNKKSNYFRMSRKITTLLTPMPCFHSAFSHYSRKFRSVKHDIRLISTVIFTIRICITLSTTQIAIFHLKSNQSAYQPTKFQKLDLIWFINVLAHPFRFLQRYIAQANSQLQ